MGAIALKLRALKDRLTRRHSTETGDPGARAIKRAEAQALRLSHERLDSKQPR